MINPAESPAYEEVDLDGASDTPPEDQTTGGFALEGQYNTLIHN